jgi:CDP-4-dehydro-6-deoxyglucose reductase, E1
MFPVRIRPDSGVRRSEFQQFMERNGVDTRMVWTGNVTRQPAFKEVPCRIPSGGLPRADEVMEQGLVLPSNHGLNDEDIDYVWETAEAFLS